MASVKTKLNVKSERTLQTTATLGTVGIRLRLLELSAEKGESSEIITALLTAEEYNISKKIVAFAGDNAKVNFGAETLGGRNNVFARLKMKIPHVIGVGCAAHIVHNTLKYASDAMPFDLESTVVKIYSHFYIYTVRTENLKLFIEESGEQYMKLLGYAKTRLLALGPAVGRILKVFDGLKAYFESLPDESEAALKKFFQNPKSKFWLLFIKDQVINIEHLCQLLSFEYYHRSVLAIEGDSALAVEVELAVAELRSEIQSRKQDGFLGSTCVF